MKRSRQNTSLPTASCPDAPALAALTDLLCHLPPSLNTILTSDTAIYQAIHSLLVRIDLAQRLNPVLPCNAAKSWSWQTLFEDTETRYGLLHLPPNGHMPLHDHADAYGLSLVLEGNPVLLSPDLKPEKGSLWIDEHQISARLLHEGQISLILPGIKNIHGFQGGPTPSTIFSLVNRKPDQDRNWYFSRNAGTWDSVPSQWRPLLLALVTLAMAGLPVTHAGDCDLLALGQFLKDQTQDTDINHLLACAREDYPQAQFWAADAYQSARGVTKDLTEAAYWYGRAAQQGMPEAQLRYGEMMLNGEGITENSAEALDWIFKSYMAGNKEAGEMFHYLIANPAPLDC